METSRCKWLGDDTTVVYVPTMNIIFHIDKVSLSQETLFVGFPYIDLYSALVHLSFSRYMHNVGAYESCFYAWPLTFENYYDTAPQARAESHTFSNRQGTSGIQF